MAIHSFTMNIPAPIIYAKNLFEPRAFQKNGKSEGDGKYGTTFLIMKTHIDAKPMISTMRQVAREAFPDRFDANGKEIEPVKYPLKDGDKLAAKAAAAGRNRDFYKGTWVLEAKANKDKPPRLVVLEADGRYVPFVDDNRPLASKFFYDGVGAVGLMNFASYEGFGGGITAYLNRILSVKKGKPINIGKSDEETFGDAAKYREYMGEVSDEDPTAGLDEDQPF